MSTEHTMLNKAELDALSLEELRHALTRANILQQELAKALQERVWSALAPASPYSNLEDEVESRR